MLEATACKNMSEIRESIDSIDDKIVELISLRSKYVYEAAKFKKDETAVKDTSRVQKVLETKADLALKYGASPELIQNIYKMMIDFFISEEMKEWEKENL